MTKKNELNERFDVFQCKSNPAYISGNLYTVITLILAPQIYSLVPYFIAGSLATVCFKVLIRSFFFPLLCILKIDRHALFAVATCNITIHLNKLPDDIIRLWTCACALQSTVRRQDLFESRLIYEAGVKVVISASARIYLLPPPLSPSIPPSLTLFKSPSLSRCARFAS